MQYKAVILICSQTTAIIILPKLSLPMPATKLLKIVVLLCIIIHGSQIRVFSQDISWMKGLWKEESGMPFRVPGVKCNNSLEITAVADSTFAGLQTTFFSADTAVRITYACNGLFSQSNKHFHRGDIIYKKSSEHEGLEWKNCGICDTRTCSLYVEHDKIFLFLSTKDCDSTCNGTITYYRDLNDFDSLTKHHLTKLYYYPEYSSVLVSYTEHNTQRSSVSLSNQNNSSEKGSLLNNDTLPSVLRERTNKLAQTLQISSPYIEVILLDDAEIDGDIVSLYDNNKEVLSHKTLGKEVIKYSIKADKQHAYHELVLVAENLGGIPPNTALMRIRAGDKKYELTTRANMHENAKIVIEYTGE